MNLYVLTQKENQDYDTYSACIVCAETLEDARVIHPSGYNEDWSDTPDWSSWASSPKNVSVELIGKAADSTKRGLILASFHAG